MCEPEREREREAHAASLTTDGFTFLLKFDLELYNFVEKV